MTETSSSTNKFESMETTIEKVMSVANELSATISKQDISIAYRQYRQEINQLVFDLRDV